jgi:ubiquinone/menaquinone biosynthesis C-methylase UbiE
MDYLRCPRCRASIDVTEGVDDVVCADCGTSFPRLDGFIDFVDSRSLEEFARWQRDIYEREVESQHIPYYMEPEQVRRHQEYCVRVARKYGPLLPCWLGMDLRRATDSLTPREGELVLDVGCNDGLMLAVMREVYGTRGVGVDFSRAAVSSAAACRGEGNVFFSADALNLPFADETFDVAVSYSVMEHVSDHARMVSEMARVLKPGGRLLVFTTCRRDRWTWHWWQRTTSGGRYGLGLDDQAGHDPERFLDQAELSDLLHRAGLHRLKVYAVHTLYTLMLDETFPGFFIRLLTTPRLIKPVRALLDTADELPNSRGYCNELLATAWKEER